MTLIIYDYYPPPRTTWTGRQEIVWTGGLSTVWAGLVTLAKYNRIHHQWGLY